jgi:hypothetical protein
MLVSALPDTQNPLLHSRSHTVTCVVCVPTVTAPDRVKETPLVLKALYDLDLAEEEVLLAWAGKADACSILGVSADQTKQVRACACVSARAYKGRRAPVGVRVK